MASIANVWPAPGCKDHGFLAVSVEMIHDRRALIYGIMVEWTAMEPLAKPRPAMIPTRNSFPGTLEDLGGGRGVTAPTSGPVVVELKQRVGGANIQAR